MCTFAKQYEGKGSPIKWELLVRMCLATGMGRGGVRNTTWRDIDSVRMTVDVTRKKGSEDTWEWRIKDTERFYLAVRNDVLDRARVAAEASGRAQSVAYLLRVLKIF